MVLQVLMSMIGTWMYLAPLGFGLLVKSDVLAAGDPIMIIVNEGTSWPRCSSGSRGTRSARCPSSTSSGTCPRCATHTRTCAPWCPAWSPASAPPPGIVILLILYKFIMIYSILCMLGSAQELES